MRLRNVAFLAALLGIVPLTSEADQYWGGSYNTQITMTKAQSPHFVGATLVLGPYGKLTIEPGANVFFSPGAALEIEQGGRLIADALNLTPIVMGFKGAGGTYGSWPGIRFREGSYASLSVIRNVRIYYGGTASEGAIFLEREQSPTIQNVSITHSAGPGLFVNGSGSYTVSTITVENCLGDGIVVTGPFANVLLQTSSIVRNNGRNGVDLRAGAKLRADGLTIGNNTGYAIGMEPGTSIGSIANLTVTGNGVPAGSKNAIGYRGGQLALPETWAIYPNLQWHILGTTTVSGTTGTLTIPSGQTIYFAPNVYLDVAGKITADGVKFTSIQAAPGVAPLLPPVITATGAASSVTVSWPALTGVTGYEVYRKDAAGAAWALKQTTSTNSYLDAGVTTGRTYLYKAVAVAGEAKSPDSNLELATTIAYTDPVLTSGTTPVKAKHIIEARTAVNAVCAFAGTTICAALPFTGTALDETYTKTQPIRAADVAAVQNQITSLRSAIGASAAVFRESVAAGMAVKRIHMEDLRTGAN